MTTLMIIHDFKIIRILNMLNFLKENFCVINDEMNLNLYYKTAS